jgi:hypothetical protein
MINEELFQYTEDDNSKANNLAADLNKVALGHPTIVVLASWGGFKGTELYFPKYRVAVDYRPGDVILADVHELHGNFPLIEGIRVACVFFVREGIHECPTR